jgi:peptidoglycan/xylan/chitin deacetylase (PgdA/CDA1 family)
MLLDQDIKGDDLPLGTLCLTYDDGPGPHSDQLGRYLAAESISAAFFVVGKHVEQRSEIVRRLSEAGHIIGNHTYSHPGLVTLAKAGGDVVAELARADAVIRPFVRHGTMFFRPPYGSWREKSRPDGPEDAPTSIVAEKLRAGGLFADFVGPIKWDIVGEDWECWRQGLSVEEVARRHIDAVEKFGRGIVLMHDYCEDAAMQRRNRTMEMTRLLIPELKSRGYRFVSLDAVPQVRKAYSNHPLKGMRVYRA